MAKFKVGDKVVSGYDVFKGGPTYTVINPDKNGKVIVRVIGGSGTEFQFNENELMRILANSCANPVVANALAWKNAVACNLGDNPNYNPAEGMKLLETRAFMFKPSMAKKMVEDAMKKGVKVPDKVMEMYKSGVWNAANSAPVATNALNGYEMMSIDDALYNIKGGMEEAVEKLEFLVNNPPPSIEGGKKSKEYKDAAKRAISEIKSSKWWRL